MYFTALDTDCQSHISQQAHTNPVDNKSSGIKTLLATVTVLTHASRLGSGPCLQNYRVDLLPLPIHSVLTFNFGHGVQQCHVYVHVYVAVLWSHDPVLDYTI